MIVFGITTFSFSGFNQALVKKSAVNSSRKTVLPPLFFRPCVVSLRRIAIKRGFIQHLP